jgi:multidrug resistance efflux pump
VTSAEANLEKAQKDFDRANNLVAKGNISKCLFDQAKAAFDIARADLAKAQAQSARSSAGLLQSQEELARTKAQLGAAGEDNAQLRDAKAALETTKLNLSFTEVRASVDGHVTNLTLCLGSQAVANQPALALVDEASCYVHGYFRENLVGRIKRGQPAVITLMSHPHRSVTGRVSSIGWGIYQNDGASGPDLLPTVGPTFEWIRLAQRVTVRIHLDEIPDGVERRVGTTASVMVMTGAGDPEGAPPVPAALRRAPAGLPSAVARMAVTVAFTSSSFPYLVAGQTGRHTAARRAGVRRLPDMFIPDDAGLTFAFKEGRQEHGALCDCRCDTEGGRQDKLDGMKIDRNRLSPPRRHFQLQESPPCRTCSSIGPDCTI